MEIERKYLLKNSEFEFNKYPYKEMMQSYISVDPVIRIRQEGQKYVLAIKGEGTIARQEYELEITKEQFESLSLKTETKWLKKKRYYVPLREIDEVGLVAEIDVYEEFLEGLIIVEIEFESLEDSEVFTPPFWFGKEVSNDPLYSNSSLIRFGRPMS